MNDFEWGVYWALKEIMGYAQAPPLDDYSCIMFVEAAEKCDPELVATVRAKIRLGIA